MLDNQHQLQHLQTNANSDEVSSLPGAYTSSNIAYRSASTYTSEASSSDDAYSAFLYASTSLASSYDSADSASANDSADSASSHDSADSASSNDNAYSAISYASTNLVTSYDSDKPDDNETKHMRSSPRTKDGHEVSSHIHESTGHSTRKPTPHTSKGKQAPIQQGKTATKGKA